jgi:protein-tyrosine phosphatase
MTKILDWKRAEDPRDVIHLAVQALAEGHLVAFPSDVHYMVVASALRPTAVNKLGSKSHSGQRSTLSQACLMLRSADEVLDYVPDVSPVAIRLANRGWPGPLDILVKNGHATSLTTQLEQTIQEKIYTQDQYLALSIPRHESLEQVIRLSAGPMLVAPAFRNANGDFAAEAQHVSSSVALAIDGGTISNPGQTTIVRVDGSNCTIEREGRLSEQQLTMMSQFTIALVCTGNTCRSPMAAAILNSKLKRRFSDKFQNGSFAPIVACSAGVAASSGDPASSGAIAAMENIGLDLRKHQSQPASPSLLDRADLILTMTHNHRQNLLSRWPYLVSKTFGLAPDQMDVSDPFGGPVEVYEACAKKIDQYLDAWVEKLDADTLAVWSHERK